MTRSRKLRLVAIIAILAMVLPLVLVSTLNAVTDPMSAKAWSDLDVYYEEEIAPVDPAIKHDSFVIGEEVYNPTLTGSGNGVPDGWLAVPYGVVPWANGGAAGGWATTGTDANQTINTARFTYTSTGLKTSLGGGDFALLMPTLKDSAGNEVEDYVYSVKATYNEGAGGQFGLITGTRGSETTFAGGTFHSYYGPAPAESWYRFHYGQVSDRINQTKPLKTDANGIAAPVGGKQFTLTVYHYDGMNYFFLDDKFVDSFADKDYYDGATLSGVGLFFCGAQPVLNEISVKKISYGTTSAITLNEPTIRYANALGALTGDKSEGLRFTATVDKTAATYTDYVNGTYSVDNENVKFGLLLIPKDLVPENGLITVDTPKVVDTVIDKIDKQDSKSLTYAVSLLNIPDEQRDRVYVARAYMKVKSGDSWNYIYSKTKISRSYAGVANLYYTDATKETIRNRVDEIFEGSKDYKGSDVSTISFSVFADLHYYKGGYITPVSHLDKIMAKANINNVDFVMQAGDFCNNFPASPEITNAYLNNSYDLPVYGVMGNHDLENGGKMEAGTSAAVTSKLTNQNDNVVWGTADGKIGDGKIAYYYFDVDGFRIICTDTNHYWNLDTNAWEHYPSWYSGANPNVAPNTTKSNSLGDTQRAWLERVLMDAANEDIPCIVISHASMAGTRGSSQCEDYAEVQEIFRKANDKNLGTVLMVINGHHHTNHTEYVDGILYFDMNTSNGAYVPDGANKTLNYAEDATFEYVEYDADGNAVSTTTKLITTLGTLGQNEMFYFEGPLSAIVHVSSNGRIVIEGDQTDWYLDVAPAKPADGEEPFVNSGVFSTGLY